jgi:glycosyltransferase involved in cell wall biosynthesis
MSVNNTTTQPLWELDSLQLRGRQVFITGWLLAPELKLDALQLRLLEAEGRSVAILPLNDGQARPDVAQAHPHQRGAGHCGFVGVGAWPRALKASDQLQLEGLAEQQLVLRLALPWPAGVGQSGRAAGVMQLLRYGRRALRLLRSGQWRSLIEKLKRQLGERPQRQVVEALPLHWQQQLQAAEGPGVQLVVDHRLGGGANHYRQERVQHWLNQGGCVLVLTYHLAGLQPMLQLFSRQGDERLGLTDWGQLPALLQPLTLRRITYNTAVSLADPETLAAVLLHLQQQHGAELQVLVHDFYLICPSHFLLDEAGRFCGIPGQSRCAQCLPSNRHGFTSLFGGNLERWRQIWGPVLQAADVIVAFSNDSVQQLRRAYQEWPDGPDWLQGKPIQVRPHEVEHLARRSITPSQSDTLVIGIVGQIGHHKGAAVVQHLAAAIAAAGGKERICVIGSVEAPVDGRIVRQTGPYQREQLAHWIEQSGANVMLFPSIWPETFSYVVQELMVLQLPLACFNLGAPAERVRHYPLGVVLDSQDPQMVLKQLRHLFQACYRSPSQHRA